MYRVYDTKKKRWIKEEIYLAPNNDLFVIKHMLFGFYRLKILSPRNYIYHHDIGLNDKNKKLIYEGDIVKTPNGEIGLIVYSNETASYIMMDYKHSKYYTLNKKICESSIEVIDNICDNPELIQH